MFLTLNEYLLGARRILNLHGFRCHRNDEDAISYVASYMMKADNTWNGTSSRNTWRYNQALYAIKHLKAKYRKQKRMVSLSKVVQSKGREITLADMIEAKPQHNCQEQFNDLLSYAKTILTDLQFVCLKMYYADHMTLEQIGNKFGVSKEAIRQNIERAIKNIKNEHKYLTNNTSS